MREEVSSSVASPFYSVDDYSTVLFSTETPYIFLNRRNLDQIFSDLVLYVRTAKYGATENLIIFEFLALKLKADLLTYTNLSDALYGNINIEITRHMLYIINRTVP